MEGPPLRLSSAHWTDHEPSSCMNSERTRPSTARYQRRKARFTGSWDLENRTEGCGSYRFHWHEQRGPEVRPPSREGSWNQP